MIIARMPKIRGACGHGFNRRGLSLMELMAAVLLLGIIASIVLPRLGTQGVKAKQTACDVHRGNVEVQSQLFFRNKGRFPAADLSDIGADANYFPEGLPVCPLTGQPYQIDTTTGRISGHSH